MKYFEEITDEELVALIRIGDKELFAKLIDRYEAKLIRYATYLMHDQDRAADAVQESFIKVFINLNVFDVKKKFSSWIYRIVHNEVMNLHKKHRVETPLLETMDFAGTDSVEDTIYSKDTKKEVGSCLHLLHPRYAEPLTLHFIEEKSYEEISTILRLPMGTVATRINRAKKLMKTICMNQGKTK